MLLHSLLTVPSRLAEPMFREKCRARRWRGRSRAGSIIATKRDSPRQSARVCTYFRAAALEREGENESAEAAWHPQVGVTLLPSSTFDSFCCNSLRADPAEVASRRLSRALRRGACEVGWELGLAKLTSFLALRVSPLAAVLLTSESG